MHALLLTLVLVGGGSSCAGVLPSVEAAPEEPGLVFFEALGPNGGVVYLLGTVHIGRRPAALDPAIERAFAASESLVVEVRPSELEPRVAAENLLKEGTLPDGQVLQDVLSPETWSLLEKRLAGGPIPLAGLMTFEPWVVSLMLQGGQYESMGLSQEHGVDSQMVRKAKARKMRISGLETAQDQLRLFDTLDYATQELLLLDMLKSPEEGRRQLSGLLDAWERGDLAEIESFIIESFAEYPAGEAFLEATIFERNRRMADSIGTLLKAKHTVFVAVGAGHVVGDLGIPKLLERNEFSVRRVPPDAIRVEHEAPGGAESAVPPAAGAP